MAHTLLRIHEAAEVFDVHPNTIRRWVKRGLLGYIVTPTGERRIYVEDMQRIVIEGTTKAIA